MYCPSCGQPNREECAHCAYCGAQLVDNSVRPQYVQVNTDQIRQATQDLVQKTVRTVRKIDRSKIQNMSKKTKTLIVAGASVLLVFILFLAIGSSLSNPKHVATKYFKSYAEGDYDAMYSCLASVDSQFVTKDSFVKYMSARNERQIGKIESYEVREEKDMVPSSLSNRYDYLEDGTPSSTLTKRFYITYISSGSGSVNTFQVTLALQKSRKLLFFKQYKVGIDQYLAQDVQFLAPPGATVTVDGVTLKNGVPYADDENMLAYSVGSMFAGEHTVKVSGAIYQEMTQTVSVYDGSTETLRPEISENQKQVLAVQTENVLRTMCSGALSGKSFSALGLQNCSEDVAEYYEDLCDTLRNDDGTGYTSITFASFSTDSVYRDDTEYECNLDFQYNYVRMVMDWWTDELRQEVSDYAHSGSVSASFAYDAAASAWKLMSFYCRSF